MKALRWLLLSMLFVGLLLGSLVLWVQGVAVPLEQQPLPDPGQVIALPNGETRTLAQLLAGSEPGEPAAEPEGNIRMTVVVDGVSESAEGLKRSEVEAYPALEADDALEQFRRWRRDRWKGREPDGSDLFQLAEYKLDTGDTDAALALYRSVPGDHPQYARAQRRVGWDIYTKQLDDPRRGVAFVQSALYARPEDGNCWQDIVRVYGHTLGLPVD